jgi:nucleoside-diphosphate-sugar epimerase
MCTDSEFDEATSHWVTGPLHKERWIYSSSKQLLDRIIYAYGKHHHLSYTLFRPFNWYGPRLDHLSNAARSSRVITQFIGNILRGEDILLVNGGQQQRSFTYIEDGIHALLKIIENKNDCAAQTVFNIGNPFATISIRSLAELIVRIMKELKFPLSKTSTLRDITEEEYYGLGYQDVSLRVPKIERAKRQLNWQPKIDLMTGLTRTIHMIIND